MTHVVDYTAYFSQSSNAIPAVIPRPPLLPPPYYYIRTDPPWAAMAVSTQHRSTVAIPATPQTALSPRLPRRPERPADAVQPKPPPTIAPACPHAGERVPARKGPEGSPPTTAPKPSNWRIITMDLAWRDSNRSPGFPRLFTCPLRTVRTSSRLYSYRDPCLAHRSPAAYCYSDPRPSFPSRPFLAFSCIFDFSLAFLENGPILRVYKPQGP